MVSKQKLLSQSLTIGKPLFIILLGLLLLLTLSNIYFLYQNRERNRVSFVVDGDSFQLSDGRRIRLLSLDSPERGRCGYEEARVHLSELVNHKIVRLSDIVIDDYM